ncbi:MAG: TonB-dependent receptor [Cyanobacteria bacterium P01_D01_bin.115]
MNTIRTGTEWGLVSITSVVASCLTVQMAAQPAWANAALLRVTDELATTEQPTQVVQEAVVPITDIQINITAEGIEIELVTEGAIANPTTSILGNALIIEIPNAVLALSEGDAFEVFGPAEGIALVTATNQPSGRVQVVITGTNAVPVANLSLGAQGLILSVMLGTPTDAAAPEEDAIQVIVTAERTPEEAQDVPISLTVLTEADIENANVTSIEDIAGSVPNFTFFSGENAVSPIYSIRGLGNSNFLAREAVAFYIDDVPYDRANFISTDLPDIEQVEVLRGPQSTLYGRNALSGVVNITTRQPTNEFEFNAGSSYGSYDAVDLQAGVSGPIVEDQLFFRLSGNYFSRDGYINNSFLDDGVDERESWNGRAQLLWTPSEDWEISLNTFFEDLQNGVNFVTVNEFDPADAFDIAADVDNSFDRNSNTQALRITYTHPDFRATSITARRFSTSEQRADADGTPADIVVNTNDFESTVLTQEFRFQSPIDAIDDRGFEWLVGGYFESREFNSRNDGFTFGEDAASIGFPVGVSVADADVDETIFAGFAQVSVRPVDPLTLTAGVRYESFNGTLDRLENTFTPPGGPTFTTFSASSIEQDTNIWLPRFVAEYRFNPDVMVYGSIARGYRPGGVNFRGDATTLTFEAEKSWNYEIGLKSSWLDDRLQVNLALFHNDVNDYQVPFVDSFDTSGIGNAEVSITGGELEVRATPLDGLDIIAGLGLSNARFTNYREFDGNRVPYAPEATYNLALQYRDPIGFFARVELQGTGTTYFDDDNSLRQDAYAVVNARLGYEFDDSGIYLYANNILGAKYFVQAANFQPFGFLVAPGAPATVGLQFISRF